MLLSTKIGAGSGITFVAILLFGWVAFPAFLKNKIKSNVALKPGGDMRNMWTKVPFSVDFKVYIFNVTNPSAVDKGDSPVVDEVGPYFFDEWKEKVNMQDDETDDTVSYNPKSRFVFNQKMSGKLTMDETVTIPHPLMTGMSLAVARDKPSMLTLLSKALAVIFRDPTSIFVTATVREILFDGLVINCTVSAFSAKAVCTQLKSEAKNLERVGEDVLLFSFFGMKNKTLEGKFKVKRGIKNYRDLGRVLEYEGQKELSLWSTKECNQYYGTDSTIFPPFLEPEEGVWSFAPDLCRSLGAFHTGTTTYNNIPVDVYKANFGDMSSNKEDKCFCPTPTTCLKKGVMDLSKCSGAPIIASLPHFYDADPSYVDGVRGLHPNGDEHGIEILFERMTGTPVSARKRLQFSIPLEKIPKLNFMKDVPETVLPILWVDEGVALNETYTHQLEASLFRVLKIFKLIKWLILSLSLIGLGTAAFLRFYKKPNYSVKPALGNMVPTLNPYEKTNVKTHFSNNYPE